MAALPLLSLLLPLLARAQSISTNTPTPPLQWINLGAAASGSPPNPVRDPCIGFDSSSSSIVVFGGSSSAGTPNSDTYVLSTSDLQWASPANNPGIGQTPPPRSLAVCGFDSASSYRTDMAMYGGLGSNGEVLSDLWNYDYSYQFWYPATLSSPGPGPRSGASGGVAPVPAGSQSLNTTFLLSGGSNGSAYASDTWELSLTGTLSPNNLGQVDGAWAAQSPTSPAGPARVGQASAVLAQSTLLLLGGCNASAPNLPSPPNATCALPSYSILTFPSGLVSSPPSWSSISSVCPGARYAPTLAPNLNPSSSSTFPAQAFLLFGALDPAQWNTSAMQPGEVGVLDTSAGTWARVVPTGPAPPWRSGAVAVSFSGPMVGPSSTPATDTVVFGGVDESGNYLNDIWVLRAFNGVVQSSGEQWSGYGDGSAVQGVGSQGTGVVNTYLTECVPAVQTGGGSSTSSGSPSSTSGGSGPAAPSSSSSSSSTGATGTTYPYDASSIHKSLSAISLAVFLPSLLLLRSASSLTSPRPDVGRTYVAALGGIGGWVLGVVGFALALSTTAPTSTTLMRRSSSSSTFQTAHGQAGLALFLLLYVLLPLWALSTFLLHRRSKRQAAHRQSSRVSHEKHDSQDSEVTSSAVGGGGGGVGEKLGRSASDAGGGAHEMQARYTQAGRDSLVLSADEPSPTQRTARRGSTPSFPLPPLFRVSQEIQRDRRVSESALATSPSPGSTPSTQEAPPTDSAPTARSFEVVNRPRRVSAGGRLMPNDRQNHGHGYGYGGSHQRAQQSLSDLSWLQRRGHIGGVAELDLALSTGTRSASGHGHGNGNGGHHQGWNAGGQGSSPEYFGSPDPLNPSLHELPAPEGEKGAPSPKQRIPRFPPRATMLFRALLLSSLTFGCILALVALRQRAPIGAFAAFLAWTLLFFIALVVLAAYGRPDPSSLAVIVYRLRTSDLPAPPPPPSGPAHTPLPIQSPESARSPPSTRPPSRAGGGGLGPYTYHTPAYHRANSHDADEGRPTSIEESVAGEDDGDEDDEQRQRQIEQEMASRDVVVMTIPRRQLKIVNV